jgi:MFS family permease
MKTSQHSEMELSARAEITAYSTAFISIGMLPMTQMLVPLWCAVELGMTATQIGIIAGARAFLATFFSIHSGALLDRIGVRRVGTFCALASVLLMLLYPLVPLLSTEIQIQFLGIIALQLVTGFLHTIGWIGAQTQIGQLTRGSSKHMGRFVSISNISNFVTPPLAGWCWDLGQSSSLGGAWVVFSIIALWNLALWISITLMPIANGIKIPKGPPTLRELLPSITDYREALRLILIPAVAFVVTCSFLMNGLIQLRMNFLSVYMEGIGFEGSIIGLITGFAFLIGGLTALPTERAKRIISPHWIVICMILLSSVGNALVGNFRSLEGLIFSTILFGAGVGLGMAYVLSLLSKGVPTEQFGLSVGLRTTANRCSAAIVPIIAGLVIDSAGGNIGTGFLVISLIFILGALVTSFLSARSKNISETFKS